MYATSYLHYICIVFAGNSDNKKRNKVSPIADAAHTMLSLCANGKISSNGSDAALQFKPSLHPLVRIVAC